MLKRYEGGFTLLETLTALLVIVICASLIVPIYIKTIQEKESIVNEEEALSVLNETLDDWTTGARELPPVIKRSGVDFQLNWTFQQENHTRLCVVWKGQIKRSKQICGEAMR